MFTMFKQTTIRFWQNCQVDVVRFERNEHDIDNKKNTPSVEDES